MMLFNRPRKQIYFLLHAANRGVEDLFQTVGLLRAKSFTYYVGSQAQQKRDFDFPYFDTREFDIDLEKFLNGPFVWIESETFDLIAFIGYDAPFSLINVLYFSITGQLLFKEKGGVLDIKDLGKEIYKEITI